MGVGTIRYYNEQDKNIEQATCPHCNSIINVSLDRTVQDGRVFFVPLKMNVRYYSTCPDCGVDINYTKKMYKQIKTSSNPRYDWNKISKTCYEKAKKKAEEGIIRSPKSKFLAAFLALIGCFFGLHNLYLGHKKRFLVNMILFSLSAISVLLMLITKSNLALLFTVSLATNIYWGLFDFIRILCGRAKDSDGGYLLTEKEYKRRLLIHALMS